MRIRVGLATLVLVVGVFAVACGSDDDSSDSPDPDQEQDGGSSETVSTDEWRDNANTACDKTKSDLDAESAPADLATPGDAQALDAAATYLDQVDSALQSLVAELDDMPQPSDSTDAATANTVVDDLGAALQALDAVRDAASTGDTASYASAYTSYADAVAKWQSAASSAGLSTCAELP